MPYLVGYVTPQDYGAVADGVTDDTTAVQDAINAVSTAGGGTVFFPEGSYKLTAAVVPKDGVSLLGVGDTASVLVQSSTTVSALAAVDLNNVTIAKLGLTGPASGSGNGIAFTLSSASSTPYVTISDVTVKDFGNDGVQIEIPIVSNLTRVVAQSCGGYGFNLYGLTAGSGAPGTSASLTSCYANSCTTGGYRLYKTSYFALNGCAADSSTVGYLIEQGWSNALIGCGSEGNTTGVEINGGYGNSVTSQFIYNNQGVGIWVTGTAHLVGLYQVVDVTPGGGATNFIKVDSGSFCTIVGQSNTTANSLGGTTSVLDDGAGGVDIPGYTFINNTLEIGGTNNLLIDSGDVQTTGATSGTTAYQAKVTGDTQPRLSTTAGGVTSLGPGGSTAVDTVYGRAAAGVFYTSKNLLIGTATALGDNGVGEIQLHNYTTPPTSPPSNGVVLFAQSAAAIPAMLFDPSGSKRSLVDAVAIATADQTFTTTSQVASTYMTLAVETSATYLMEIGVIFSAVTSGNTIFSWTGPTGATMKWNDTTTAGDYTSTISGTNSYSFSASERLAFFKGKLITAGTAGNLTLTVSNSVGGASTSSVLTDSWLRLTRVK